MYNGLWTVTFSTIIGSGSGVLVLNGNQALGGDFGYYYSGDINITDDQLSGAINVVKFNPNAVSVFGDIGSFTLQLTEGRISSDSFDAEATIAGNPNMTMRVRGEKKVDIDE